MSGKTGFERRVGRENNGGDPIHRMGAVTRGQIRIRKRINKSEWYANKPKEDKYKLRKWGNKNVEKTEIGGIYNPPSAPIFIPRTPGGKLIKSLRKL